MRHTGGLNEGDNMKRLAAGILVSIAALGVLSACGDDDLTLPVANTIEESDTLPGADDTLPLGITLPDDVTIPAGGLPSDASIPEEVIDVMITQFEAAGMKVDRDCFKSLLSDDALRNLVAAGGTPTPEVIQKFFACITAG